ncbi:MAG: type II secretion system protein [Lachnospiraceae bacterium]|nr:type II secretion system protein [Lachnospiraceae bacterium]
MKSKRKTHPHQNNLGFSLVELIIVIAIMAILAGVIAPSVIRYIRKSRAARATDEARVIVNSVEAALASSHASNFDLNMDMTYIAPSGKSYKCGMVNNWMLSRAQNNSTSDIDETNEADYYFAQQILIGLGAEDSKTYNFFRFTGDEEDPLGCNCEDFVSDYNCPGLIVVYGTSGKVLYLQYYNYGCLIEYVAGDGYELIEDEEFVGPPTLQ